MTLNNIKRYVLVHGKLSAERTGEFANVAKKLGTEITWSPNGTGHIQSFNESAKGMSGVVLTVQKINSVTELCSAEAVDTGGNIGRIDILNGAVTGAPGGGIRIEDEIHSITIHPDLSATIYHHTK